MTTPMLNCPSCMAANPPDARYCYRCGQSLAQPQPSPKPIPLVLLTLTCPSCGGALKVNPQEGQAVCGHCGITHLVVSNGGVVTLRAMQQMHAQVQQLVRTTADIGEGLAGAGQNLSQQSAHYVQSAATNSLTQELLSVRKELAAEKARMNFMPMGLLWGMLIGASLLFFVIMPSMGHMRELATPLRYLGLAFDAFCLVFILIFSGTRSKAKKKVDVLEKRLQEIETALHNAGGSLGK